MDHINKDYIIRCHLNDSKVLSKISDFLNDSGVFFCYWEHLGSGDEGVAFKIHDYVFDYGVVKLTTRKIEYDISLHLGMKDFKHLYKTLGREVIIPNELYLIFKPYYIIDEFLKKIKDYNFFELMKVERIKEQIEEMRNEFRYFGKIEDFDLHGGNLGWERDNLVHFDIDEYPYGLFKEDYFL